MTSTPGPQNPPPEWMPSALVGIGMATVATNADGRIQFMNAVAEELTGWSFGEAEGRLLNDVLRIETEVNRGAASLGLKSVLATGKPISLTDHTIMIHRNGTERRIDHGAAAILNKSGEISGAAFLFCDVSERQRQAQTVEDARAFAVDIIQTMREPLVVLDASLRVTKANRSFYNTFQVKESETIHQPFLELAGLPWDVPTLRELLLQIIPRDQHFDDFEVTTTFPELGTRSLLLNARRLPSSNRLSDLILLAIEDQTAKKQDALELGISEKRYRRLFETARDGILLVDPVTRLIFDANPYLLHMLGYTHNELIGKELWQIGLFQDIESNKAAFRTLQDRGYVRYDNLPLKTRDQQQIDVEFVSNVYPDGDIMVIQCNIRDVMERKRVEQALAVAHASLETRVIDRTKELAHVNASLSLEILRREKAEADRRELQQQLVTVQERERLRISRELHDAMGQHLTALGLGIQLIKNSLEPTSPQTDQLQKLLALTDQIGREVHHLAMELRPTALDDLGLTAALATYAETWTERSGLEIDFHYERIGEERLPAMIETALYRVVQEALTNVLRHAGATRVSIVLQRTPETVSAVIDDNGRGFDAESLSNFRLGILGMRERMSLMGGTLTVESEPGQGTAVFARIPLQSDAGEEAS